MRLHFASKIHNITRNNAISCSKDASRAVASKLSGRYAYGQNYSFYTTSSTPDKYTSSAFQNGLRSFSSEISASALRERGVFDSRNLLTFETLQEMQVNASIAFADNPLFGTYTETIGNDPKFEWMTYGEFGERVKACRIMLKDLGVKEYSKVGIISNNRWEWATIASATYSLNGTLVPMYEAQLPADWSYILNDSGCDALFCATQDIYDRCKLEVLPQTPTVKAALCFDASEGEDHAFATHMKTASQRIENGEDPSSSILLPTQEDLANLVYTSGTTGKPKGVELTHSNTVSNVKGVRNMVENVQDFIRQDDVSLAFLPWAHSYGQTCELWVAMAHGGSMGICRGVPSILEDLQLVRPKVLFAVPTLYKRIYDGVHNLIENSSPVRKKLMLKALELGKKNAKSKNGEESMGLIDKIQYKALDSIVLSKIRDRFGGRLRHGFVAGAACPSEVINFMDNIGIPICEGYGLTETSPIIAINTPSDRNPGCVGKTLPGVEVAIMGEDGAPLPPGEEGEICCYGPNVMRGYYKNKEATEEVLSMAPDGRSRLFHTGDLGRMSADGWIRVTGRLKEQYKLENGKYVCPTPIEEAIGMSRFVMQVVLCGANRPYNVALIVPDWNAVKSELKIDESTKEEELVNDERVKSLIDNDIMSKCSKLKKFEVPQQWAFVAPFTAANNMLTPKMSIRRHMVIKTYEDVIGSMYDDMIMSSESIRTEKDVNVA